MHTDKQYTDKFALEVIALHRFFEDWFGGYCENSDQVFTDRLSGKMREDFTIILPAGIMLKGRDFWPEFKKLYGDNPEFQISIRNVRQRTPATGSVHVITYEEWQRNAKNSKPENNGRVSSAIFFDDERSPNGLKWFHVHETWLPDSVIAAEPFDWPHS